MTWIGVVIGLIMLSSCSIAQMAILDWQEALRSRQSHLTARAPMRVAPGEVVCQSSDGRAVVYTIPVSNGAEYRCHINGLELWRLVIPTPLSHCSVVASGGMIGISYVTSDGLPVDATKPSELRVTVIGRAGQVLLTDSIVREQPKQRSNPPSPYLPEVVGTLICSDESTAIVRARVSDAPDSYMWYRYDIVNGVRLEAVGPLQLRLESDFAFAEVSATPVAESPLVVVHWWTFVVRDDGTRSSGAWITVIGCDGALIWYAHYEDEYDHMPANFSHVRAFQDEARQIAVRGNVISFRHAEGESEERWVIRGDGSDHRPFYVAGISGD